MQSLQEVQQQEQLQEASPDSSDDSAIDQSPAHISLDSQNGTRGDASQNGAVTGADEVPDFTDANGAIKDGPPEWVCVVETRQEAERIAGLLCGRYKDELFGCDTEVGSGFLLTDEQSSH